jgi:hypothetical protein
MPLGWERLNERTQRPNALINFIKPLPGASSPTAENILNRVAAICYPFMKAHMILVQSLEEFPYNTEFVGRNFNAGEVIQLVLKDRNGRWLPQKMVEMVMVHELAHCKQMNHSKAFWKVRDAYAVELKGLWGQGYTGEGLWGRGRDLVTGDVQMDEVDPGDVPEHLCGGTYGRRAKKRRRGGKEKETLSYAERKQRRILKKFGANGQSLGADDDTKVKLEGGVEKKGKPRVAGSARGRELRAAAALARFDPVKKEPQIKSEDTQSDSESEDEYDAGDAGAAIDVDGKKMTDDEGRALIKMCEEEDEQGDDARREMDEIRGFDRPSATAKAHQSDQNRRTASSKITIKPAKSSTTPAANPTEPPQKPAPSKSATAKPSPYVVHLDEIYKRRSDPPPKSSKLPASTTITCAVCSLINESGTLVCAVCSNVLDPRLVPDHWKCSSKACEGGKYVNSGDAGRCGACGGARSTS